MSYFVSQKIASKQKNFIMYWTINGFVCADHVLCTNKVMSSGHLRHLAKHTDCYIDWKFLYISILFDYGLLYKHYLNCIECIITQVNYVKKELLSL